MSMSFSSTPDVFEIVTITTSENRSVPATPVRSARHATPFPMGSTRHATPSLVGSTRHASPPPMGSVSLATPVGSTRKRGKLTRLRVPLAEPLSSQVARDDDRFLHQTDDQPHNVYIIHAGDRYDFWLSLPHLAGLSKFFDDYWNDDNEKNDFGEPLPMKLDDVRPEDFKIFLNFVDGETLLDETTVIVLLQLGIRFDCSRILAKCEKALIGRLENNDQQLDKKFMRTLIRSTYHVDPVKRVWLFYKCLGHCGQFGQDFADRFDDLNDVYQLLSQAVRLYNTELSNVENAVVFQKKIDACGGVACDCCSHNGMASNLIPKLEVKSDPDDLDVSVVAVIPAHSKQVQCAVASHINNDSLQVSSGSSEEKPRVPSGNKPVVVRKTPAVKTVKRPAHTSPLSLAAKSKLIRKMIKQEPKAAKTAEAPPVPRPLPPFNLNGKSTGAVAKRMWYEAEREQLAAVRDPNLSVIWAISREWEACLERATWFEKAEKVLEELCEDRENGRMIRSLPSVLEYAKSKFDE